jgi:hypothetical protein
MDLKPHKLMGPLSALSNLSTWCQVISKIQKSQKSTETTLGGAIAKDLVELGYIANLLDKELSLHQLHCWLGFLAVRLDHGRQSRRITAMCFNIDKQVVCA